MPDLPALGSVQTMIVELSQPVDASFRLLMADGSTLPLPAERNAEQPDKFLLRFTLKQSGFRLAVEGKDGQGFPFRRLTPAVFMARTE